MKQFGWMDWLGNPRFRLSASLNKCPHEAVYIDPLLGRYGCSKCHELFKVRPDKLITPPRTMTLWQRVRWALTEHEKVPVVEFVWTREWGILRQASPEFQKKRFEGQEAVRNAPPPKFKEPEPADLSLVVPIPPPAARPMTDWPTPAPIYKSKVIKLKGQADGQ